MQKKRILILGGADFQIPFVEKAKEKDLYIGVIDINEEAPCKMIVDEFFQVSVKDKDAVLKIAKKFKPDGITVGMVDIAIPTYAYVTSELNLPGIDINTAIKATNKYEMIKVFEEQNVPHPFFQYIKKEMIGIEKFKAKYPVIVKPIDMAGSRGIFFVNNDKDLNEAIESSSRLGDSGDVLVEEFMDGPEVSVELVVRYGEPYVIQITDKTTSGIPHFAETGHLQPSQLDNSILKQVGKVACDAAKAIGLKNSLAHAEIKITNNGPKMVEIGARAGGDGIAEQLIELSAGVSFPEIAIKIAFGEEFDIPENRLNKSSCIRFITTKEGKLRSIEGIEKAKNIEGVKVINIFGKVGECYNNMVDSSGRLGYVISQADNPEIAKKACDMAIESIVVNYSNGGA